jgi:hypothetical protein
MTTLGIIMLRHVNNDLTNMYWNHSYRCIRNFYPENIIMIIDDNSNLQFVKIEQPLYNVIVVNSEFHGRGELLPYYYYLKHNIFDKAIIIHDSVFINKYIDCDDIEDYKILWSFEHNWDQIEDEKIMINLFNDDELTSFYNNKKLWKGCFGGMCVITNNYLTLINNKYEISKLLNVIKNRYNRCSFERVIACLLQKYVFRVSLFGNIHEYCNWGISFSEKDNYKNLPLIKIWSGR